MMLGNIEWTTPTVAVVCVFSVGAISVLSTMWAHIETSRSENDLKRSMVERGMSAEEIERVISARPPKS